MPSNRSTPLGVVIIALLGGLSGLLGLLGSLAALGVNPLFGLFGLILSVGQLAVAVGLFNLNPWAWKWALVIYGLGAVLSLVGGDVIGVIIDVIVVVYLLSVGDHFRGRRSGYQV